MYEAIYITKLIIRNNRLLNSTIEYITFSVTAPFTHIDAVS